MNNEQNNFLYVLLKNRFFIVKTFAVVMGIVVITTFLLPKKYTVTTIILPPEQQSSPGLSLGGLPIGDFAGFFSGGMGYSLPLMTTLADVYSEILNSRTLIDQTILRCSYIDSLKLTKKYENNPETAMYLARKTFRKNYSANVTSSGFLQVEVTTGDPMYSVEISQQVLFLLDSINTSVTMARYNETLESTESQLEAVQASLDSTKADISNFREEYGTIAPNEEFEQLVSVLSEMKGRYIETSLMASAVRSGVRSGTTAQLLELETTAAALKQSIETVESGSSSGGISLSIGMDSIPRAIIEYAILQTDFEMQLKMLAALQMQLQQIEIQKETINRSIRVLDPPRNPGWKSKPKKIYIWLFFFLLTAVFVSAFLLAREKWNRLRVERPEVWNRWNDLFQEMRNDFSRKKAK